MKLEALALKKEKKTYIFVIISEKLLLILILILEIFLNSFRLFHFPFLQMQRHFFPNQNNTFHYFQSISRNISYPSLDHLSLPTIFPRINLELPIPYISSSYERSISLKKKDEKFYHFPSDYSHERTNPIQSLFHPCPLAWQDPHTHTYKIYTRFNRSNGTHDRSICIKRGHTRFPPVSWKRFRSVEREMHRDVANNAGGNACTGAPVRPGST